MRGNVSRSRVLVIRNQRRRAAKAFINTCLIITFILVFFFIGLKASAISTSAQGNSAEGYTKMYKSVMVEKDDCLWDIAERYIGVGYDDKRTYVDEIKQINQLSGNSIHYGEYLCVPYYE